MPCRRSKLHWRIWRIWGITNGSSVVFAKIQCDLASPRRHPARGRDCTKRLPGWTGGPSSAVRAEGRRGRTQPGAVLGRDTDTRPAETAGTRSSAPEALWEGPAAPEARRSVICLEANQHKARQPRNRRTSCAPIQGIVTRAPPLRTDDCAARPCVFRWRGGPSGERGSPLGSIPPPDERRLPCARRQNPSAGAHPRRQPRQTCHGSVRRGWGKLPQVDLAPGIGGRQVAA